MEGRTDTADTDEVQFKGLSWLLKPSAGECEVFCECLAAVTPGHLGLFHGLQDLLPESSHPTDPVTSGPFQHQDHLHCLGGQV